MLKRVTLVMLAAMLCASSAFARDDDSPGRDPFGWAFVSNGTTIKTSLDEWNHLDEWFGPDDRLMFARFGDKEYLIQDQSTLDRVDELVEPIRRLGEKAREIAERRGAHLANKLGKREWKERLRPFKEQRRELIRRVSGKIEALARDAVRQGRARRVN